MSPIRFQGKLAKQVFMGSKIAKEINLESNVESIKSAIEQNFPGKWFFTETCLSVLAQLKIEDITNPFALVLVGDPSTRKTTYLSFLYHVLNVTYKTDKFSPKSFVSHAANVQREKLPEIDLLPRIKDKVLITPDLTPTFGAKYDDLIENITILTRVLDGQGYTSDSGIHGSRGYEGTHMFCWLSAVAHIPYRVWRILGNLGSRLYFLKVPRENKTEAELTSQLKENTTYNEKVEACRKAVQDFVTKLWQAHQSKVKWQKLKDEEKALAIISRCALLLSKLRGSINFQPIVKTDEEGEARYSYSTPTIEQPDRANQMLYNLTRGHALIHGRTHITLNDLPCVIAVTLSSASPERVNLFELLLQNNGVVSTEIIEKSLKCSKPVATKTMKELKLLELVDEVSVHNGEKGHPEKFIRLKSEFQWFISDEFKKLRIHTE